MGRLTRIFEKDNQKYVCIDICGKKCVEGYSECHDCEPFINVMKKLAEYEDLEEQGRLIRLPYKAGERVWILYKEKQIEEVYVASIQIGEKYDRLCFAYETCIKFCKNREDCFNLLDMDTNIPDEWCKQCLLDWLQKEVE